MTRPTADAFLATVSKSTRAANAPAIVDHTRCPWCGVSMMQAQGVWVCPQHGKPANAPPCQTAPRGGTADAPALSTPVGGETGCHGAGIAKGRRKPPAPDNDAEQYVLAFLQRKHEGLAVKVLSHPMTLVAPDGDCYTPDLMVTWERHTFAVEVWEVKGSDQYRNYRAGRERFKRFRELFPAFSWHYAEKRDGVWYDNGNRMEG